MSVSRPHGRATSYPATGCSITSWFITAIQLLTLLASMNLPVLCQATAPPTDMADKSIEELMNVDVTSVSRKDQKLSKVPAAVYVVTQEAIERSGANTIPDLLRMVPGVQVAQVDANLWAISIRGFSDSYSNKVLVLIDGRTVYTPTFSGVYWDQIDIPLNDIERIEVVRGPGGTVWGANAVNGVINIITKDTQNTKGAFLSAGAGSEQTGDYLGQYGGSIGGNATYRGFVHYASFGAHRTPEGLSGNDGWLMRHAGFRSDWAISRKNSLMTEANVFHTDGGQLFPSIGDPALKVRDTDGDVLATWTHRYSDRFDSALQFYHTSYSRQGSGLSEKLNTVDFDYKSHLSIGSKNDLVWGTGYRYTSDRLGQQRGTASGPSALGLSISFNPPSKDYSLFSGFIQDEVRLGENLALTLGTKVEHNAFTGLEYEPSIRLAWTPTATQTLWMAGSNAVRQPSRLDTALHVALPIIPLRPELYLDQQTWGNSHFQAEAVHDYEVGYRISPNNHLLVDVTGFYSFYRDLESVGLVPPKFMQSADGTIISSGLQYGNALKSQNYGAEAFVTWNPTQRWKLAGSYSWLKANVYGPSVDEETNAVAAANPLIASVLQNSSVQLLLRDFRDYTNNLVEGSLPRQQLDVQSYYDLTGRLSLDTSIYVVAALPARNIPAYTRLDSRIGYKVKKNITVSLVGQNLTSPRHMEFGDVEQAIATEANRSVFGKAIWSF